MMFVRDVPTAKQNSLIGQAGLATDYSSIFGRWQRLLLQGATEIEGFADFIETNSAVLDRISYARYSQSLAREN
jgi:hypothetical protein